MQPPPLHRAIEECIVLNSPPECKYNSKQLQQNYHTTFITCMSCGDFCFPFAVNVTETSSTLFIFAIRKVVRVDAVTQIQQRYLKEFRKKKKKKCFYNILYYTQPNRNEFFFLIFLSATPQPSPSSPSLPSMRGRQLPRFSVHHFQFLFVPQFLIVKVLENSLIKTFNQRL